MKVLIYKRTHKGDPDKNGIFGHQDCMGRIRNWNYDAVIGIGGNAPWKKDVDIKYKINWIGLGPKKIDSPNKRGDEVVFSHFELYDENGANIPELFPKLFKHMYGGGKRFDMSSNLPEEVFEEVKQILNLIKDSPPSKSYFSKTIDTLEDEIHSNSLKCTGCFRGKEVEITIQEC